MLFDPSHFIKSMFTISLKMCETIHCTSRKYSENNQAKRESKWLENYCCRLIIQHFSNLVEYFNSN